MSGAPAAASGENEGSVRGEGGLLCAPSLPRRRPDPFSVKNMTAKSRVNSQSTTGSNPWPFFALTLGWSWLFWIPAVLSGQNITVFPTTLLFVLGGLSPALAALILTYLTQGAEGQRDYWYRVIDFKRIRMSWYGAILLIAPLYSALALLTGILIEGNVPFLETAASYLSNPSTILPFATFTLIYGPVPEELGWRGYALDRLQRKWSALTSSAVLGVFWSFWHLPMFFMKGSLMSEVFPLGSARFWIAFGPGILAEAIIMTWIYNNTQRSTLSAILFHFMMNFTGEFLRLPGSFKNYQFVWLVIIAITVVIAWGPATLTRQHKEPSPA